LGIQRPPRKITSALLDSRGEPVKVFTSTLYPLVIVEDLVNNAGYRYIRSRYTAEYPFYPVAVAQVNDSRAYVRAYLMRGGPHGLTKRVDTVGNIHSLLVPHVPLMLLAPAYPVRVLMPLWARATKNHATSCQQVPHAATLTDTTMMQG
jgi:hypothetical protein